MANVKYLFRFDAGAHYGLGHFSRSIALAKQILKEEPVAQISIFSEATAFMKQQKELLPFNIVLHETPDDEIFINYIRNIGTDVLVFDKLQELSKDTICKLKKYTKLIFFHNYSKYAMWADAVIIPAAHLHEKDLHFILPDNFAQSKLYFGPEYIVLNESTLPLRTIFTLRNHVTSVAITTGGTDPKGVMITLLNKINFKNFPALTFNFFVGDAFLFKDKLSNYKIIPNVNIIQFKLEDLIQSDIVIATFGVTTYELLYLGIPVISVAHAQQNANGSKYLSDNFNCISDLGLIDKLQEKHLNSAICNLSKDVNTRKDYHYKGRSLIDGKGVNRVTNIIRNMRLKS
jgi:spore coat polysaccharide biosynthesis predicted glycosyltransferase SpsG